jgi:hypothetical protein
VQVKEEEGRRRRRQNSPSKSGGWQLVKHGDPSTKKGSGVACRVDYRVDLQVR